MDNKLTINPTPADIDDIKIWHLYILLGKKRLIALFHNKRTNDIFSYNDYQWSNTDNLSLEQIQNTIYENPLILNGYTTTILIESNYFTIVPSKFIENDEDAYDLMDCIYSTDNADLWVDNIGDETILFNTLSGLQSFLYRTFPESSVHFQLTPTINFFKANQSIEKNGNIVVNITEEKVEIIAIKNKKLQYSNIFDYKESSDIVYFILNAWNMLGFDQQTDELKVSGVKDIRTQVMPTLRKYINYVMLTTLPQTININTSIHQNILLAIYQQNKK